MKTIKLPRGVGETYFVALMGPCAAGKTTIATALNYYLLAISNEHAPIVLDTSAVIRWQMANKTYVGQKLARLKEEMEPHELFKDCVTIEALIRHLTIQSERAQSRVSGIIVCGSPRTKRQFSLLGEAGVNGSFRGIHLQVGKGFAKEKAKKRAADGSNREDDQCFDERWDIHQRAEGPLLNKIRRYAVAKPSALLTVDKENTGLLDSIRAILSHLHAHTPNGEKKDFLKLALAGCYGNIHPVLTEICTHVERPGDLPTGRSEHWSKKFQEPLVGA